MRSSVSSERRLSWIAEWGQGIVAFLKVHEAWAAPVCFALAFGESLAFVSFILPATVVLIALGAFVGPAGLSLPPLLAAAACGAAFGDWLSYGIGRLFAHRIAGLWPFSRHPDMLPRARSFVDRWGAPGVFVGRFLGPLRATVPLVAGLCAMPRLPFQIANWTSACLWAVLVLAPGALGLDLVRSWFA